MDITKQNMVEVAESPRNLQRGLTNRHVQLIAIGGAIGTGLFMGSGKTISVAGPSILLVYAIIGFVLFFVLRAMGELLLSNLNYKSFIEFSADLLGPWAGFFVGWTYWLCWIVTAVADLIAISGYASFWWPNLTPWVPVLACLLAFMVFNRLAVKLFGELEFWFALIKIVAIVSLVLVGIYLVSSGFKSPDGTAASLSNILDHGNIFPHGIVGFLAGFQLSVFSFCGMELPGAAAAEVDNPEKVMPKAINFILLRVLLFYIVALAVIMAVTPWYKVNPTESPFVGMFVLAGIPIAAGLINFVVLTAAASSANSGIFSTSRMLYGLARKRCAWSGFEKLASNHTPANGLFFSMLCILIAYCLLSSIPTIMGAFTVITTISSILFMFIWSMILLSYIAYRYKRPELHKRSKFKLPGGVFSCVLALSFFIFILVLLTLEDATFMALTYTPLWFVLLLAVYLLKVKKSIHRSSDKGNHTL